MGGYKPDWLNQDKDKRRSAVNMVLKILVPWNVGKFLTSRGIS